ncbi:MAG: acyltransferase [Pseudomonadales bacterium]|nr:acyltransferase [Pseudomonadales bacterium]
MAIRQARPHIQSLTGLRFYLASAIFVMHFSQFVLASLFPNRSIFSDYTSAGHLAVDAFFVLSGFVIAYSYFDTIQQQGQFWPFIVRRLARIFPVHLFTTLLVAIPIMLYLGAEYQQAASYMRNIPERAVEFNLSELVKSLLLVQSWSLPMTVSWNFASWSISCEWLVYLLFPLYVAALKPAAGRPLVTLLLIIALYILEIVAAAVSMQQQGINGVGVIRVLPSFASGILLCRLCWQQPAAQPKQLNWLFWPMLAVLLQPETWLMIGVLPFFMLLIYLLARQHISASWLTHRWAIYGGHISFCLYLAHAALLVLSALFANPSDYAAAAGWQKGIYIVGFLLATVALTLVAHHLIEKPAFRWVTKRLSANTAKA